MKIALLFVLTIAAAFCAAAKAADFTCPSPAEQTGSNLNVDVTGEAQTILKIGNADLKGHVEKTIVDLYSKYPHADKIIILRDLLSTTCNLIKSSSQLTDEQKIDKWYAVFPLIQHLMQSSEADHDQGLTFSKNFSVSFSFPRYAGRMSNDVEIDLRLLNHEESPISVENISVIELFGNDKHPYVKLDECYDQNIVEVIKNAVNNSPPEGSRSQGSYPSKALTFVTYTNPANMKLNGKDTSFPLEILPNRPIILTVTFPVDEVEKGNCTFNFFAICPTVKFFDTRGQESVSVCPGSIEMTFSTEKYSADAYRVANLIATHEKHLGTMGPSPVTGNVYRVFAQRAGRFQLTPQMASNSCPLVAPD
jgi:hypothetical protein